MLALVFGIVAIGDRVEIVFEHVNDEMSVPRFRPAST